MAEAEKGEKGSKVRVLWERITTKSRYAVYDLDSFEMKRYFLLSPVNFFVFGLFFMIVLITAAYLVIAYTPLKESLPNYPDISQIEQDKRIQVENLKKIDALLKKQEINKKYYNSIYTILKGEVPEDPTLAYADSMSMLDTADVNAIEFKNSAEDSLLRKKVEDSEKYAVSITDNSAKNSFYVSDNIAGVSFFPPLKGEVSNEIDVLNGHYGIDIQSFKDEAVKSTLNGTVIFTGWTYDNGHIIHVQHSHNLVTIYKHNSTLLKKQGDNVKAGEPIAIVGNSGILSKGTHLHFELWYNGFPMDPKKFISFD